MRERNVIINIRVTDKEKKALERSAKRAGLSLSAFLRKAGFPTCVKKIINSDFAHLIITEENDTMTAENVCSAVGKEDNNAVEKEAG